MKKPNSPNLVKKKKKKKKEKEKKRKRVSQKLRLVDPLVYV